MRLTMRNHNKLGKYEDICDDPERLKEIVKEKSIPEQ